MNIPQTNTAPTSSLENLTSLAKRQVEFLSNPAISSLFSHHPNDVAEDFTKLLTDSRTEIQNNGIPSEWTPWWKWASEEPESWLEIIKRNISFRSNKNAASTSQCPPDIVDLLLGVQSISIPRYAEVVTLQSDGVSFSEHTERDSPLHSSLPAENIFLGKKLMGMSPKKMHEVSRMASYIGHLIDTMEREHGISISHVVDIGAGQGYLSRALSDMRPTGRDKGSIHVLALDSVDEQTLSAQRRQRRAETKKNNQGGSRGSVTHRTLQLGYDLRNDRELKRASLDDFASQRALEVVINEWLGERKKADDQSSCDESKHDGPTPMLFVALHACGSLTPTILSQVALFKSKTSSRGWYCAAAVIAGCCYNLLERSDFPLSSAVKDHVSSSSPPFDMSTNHLQLAAQVPLQWLRSEEAFTDFKLALRKISYRALLSVFLQTMKSDSSLASDTTLDQVAERRRVGRLNDSAYTDFDTFLAAAGAKLEIDLTKMRRTRFPDIENSRLVRQLEVLHILRCVLGPAVESLIVVDRLCWLMEVVGEGLAVELVNLFDQGTSSGRNLGLIVRPR